ncbi:hypothetical protein [Aliidiomarina haloalkalitolerans]|uniref:Uncharacterized protein n=1 Tax=Aliidiomarina haloalkalitolerans TaxID=859059 RepID=A0A432VU02_9GAMM|nr:hypothetical protein [Aliidiomarina haloalkalitolerans]RUO19889.1 hypothetical protein CWE06_07605 [Aliidiomarina haloalkalitolerans]
MKIYPYSRIKTVNLGPLLIAARLIGFISFILFAIAITLMIVAPFLESGVITQDLGSGTTLTFTKPNHTGLAIVASLWSVVSALATLAFSGLCAAVVSLEYTYTQSKQAATE